MSDDDICTEGQDRLVRFINIIALAAFLLGLAAVLTGVVR